MSAQIIEIADLYRRAGKPFIVARPQYGSADPVRVKATGRVGSFIGYIIDGPGCGRVKVFVRGEVHILDQDGIEAVSAQEASLA
jgi:hypothetical protein